VRFAVKVEVVGGGGKGAGGFRQPNKVALIYRRTDYLSYDNGDKSKSECYKRQYKGKDDQSDYPQFDCGKKAISTRTQTLTRCRTSIADSNAVWHSC
jgi:hypothetical protein